MRLTPGLHLNYSGDFSSQSIWPESSLTTREADA